MFSIVSIHHLDCHNSHAKFPLCSFGVSSEGAFSRSLNFNQRNLLHGQAVISCNVFPVNNSRYIKMSHRPLTVPESLRSMTPLSWLKEKKKKNLLLPLHSYWYSNHCRVQEIFNEKVNSVNTLIHALLPPPTTSVSVNHCELNEVRKIWSEVSK